jgi:hypothetical protein
MIHKEWKSIYKERPANGSICVSRVAGSEAFASGTTYESDSATFRTYENHSNRLVITVWKHEQWYLQTAEGE